MTAIATRENIPALIFPTLSPKFRRPTASPPNTTVKCSHDKNVRSFANATLGSTRTGSAIRFAAVRWRRGCVDMIVVKRKGLLRVFVEDGTRNNEHGMGLHAGVEPGYRQSCWCPRMPHGRFQAMFVLTPRTLHNGPWTLYNSSTRIRDVLVVDVALVDVHRRQVSPKIPANCKQFGTDDDGRKSRTQPVPLARPRTCVRRRT